MVLNNYGLQISRYIIVNTFYFHAWTLNRPCTESRLPGSPEQHGTCPPVRPDLVDRPPQALTAHHRAKPGDRQSTRPATKSRQPRPEATSPADSVNKHSGVTDTFPITINAKNVPFNGIYMINPQHWGTLKSLRQSGTFCIASHQLTPMFSGTPWRNYTSTTRFTQNCNHELLSLRQLIINNHYDSRLYLIDMIIGPRFPQ